MIRLVGVALSVVVGAALSHLTVAASFGYAVPAAIVTALALIGVYDLVQRKHSVLRN